MVEQFWKIVWHFLKGEKKKSNMQLPYNSEIAFQGIYNSEMKTYFQTKSGT